MPTTPTWSAAQNGLPGNLDATNRAAQAGQELGTHAVQIIYEGSAILSTPGGSDFGWSTTSNTGTVNDHDQPFIMPAGQTAIGRVSLPILAAGEGADLTVSLCPDDGSGNPVTGSPLASTVIPASWIRQLSTVVNAANASDAVLSELTDSPLAVPTFNSVGLSARTVQTWNTPAIGPNGAGNWAAPITSGNYGVLVGGFDPTASTPQAAVASFEYLGSKEVAQPVLQPSLPQAVYWAGATATTSSLVVAGGLTSTTTTTDAVWTASWNPETGSVGSWSKQTSLPTTVGEAVMVSHGDTVYLVGGYDKIQGAGGTVLGTVYTATVSNGQISSWTTTPALPGPPLYEQLVAVVGDRLIIAGGRTFSVATHTNVYYADIAADGSLGPWQTGPSLPVGINGVSPGFGCVATDTAMVIIGGGLSSGFSSAVQLLETSPAGGLGTWQEQTFFFGDVWQVFAFPEETSDWTAIVITGDSGYNAAEIIKMPLVSVPLPATGLTPGVKYHVYMHQTGGTPDDYLRFGDARSALPDLFKYRPVFSSGAWSTVTGFSMNLTVYDQTPAWPHLHTWEDPDANGLAAQATTSVHDELGQLLGRCSGTLFPNGALNVNPTFTSVVSPWVATNGTLTQSNAHTQGGFPFSGLLTPTGGFSQAYAASEQIRVPGNTHCTVDGWLYSTTGWASVSLSVNWFDSTGTYLSTSFNVVSLTAATWTQLTNVFQAPAGAAFASIVPTESGTPGATNLLYLSNLTLSFTDEAVFPSVISVDYDPQTYLPSGTTELV